MPLDAWALLVVSIGLGLGLELAFVRAQRRRRYGVPDGRGAPPGADPSARAGAADGGPGPDEGRP